MPLILFVFGEGGVPFSAAEILYGSLALIGFARRRECVCVWGGGQIVAGHVNLLLGG